MKAKNVDMCSGPLFKNILKFAIPFMLMGIFQRLYNAIDVIIVGRYAGQETLAAVGTTGSLTALLLDLFLGLSAGVGIVLGRAIGEKNEEKIGKVVHTAISISVLGGALISVFGIIFAEQCLRLISVPENVMPQAKMYMCVSFTGQIPSLFYTFGAAILRSKGDTKRPLYIVSISGIIKVILTMLFVIGFKWTAGGVAFATVISNIFSAVVMLYLLCSENGNTKLYLRKLRIDKKSLFDIMRMGIPSGIQMSIFSFANVIVQSSVNGFGSAAIAGSAAAANIGGFFYIALSSFYQAAMAFTSQNMGAKKYDRIKKIVLVCLLNVVIVWVIETIITIFAKEFLVSIYVPGDAEAIKMGVIRISIVGCTYGLCGIMEVMSGVLRGMGYSISSMIISVVGVCGLRIAWVLTAFKAIGTFFSLFLAFPLAWLGTAVLHTIMFLYAHRKLKKDIAAQLEQQA